MEKNKKTPVKIVTHGKRYGSCRHSPHVAVPCNYSNQGFCSIDGEKCQVKGVHVHVKKI